MILFFTTTHCNKCKQILNNPLVKKDHLYIINAEEFPEIATEYNIISVPTLVEKTKTIINYYSGYEEIINYLEKYFTK